MHNRLTARDMAYIAVFAALISICAWLSIPTTVPITLQTFAVFLTVFLLGGRRGTLCVAVYLLLGAVGLPVFSFFRSGPAALLGASGVVFMMIVLSSFTEMKKGGIPVTLILVVIFYLGGEIMDGIRGSDSISQLTHIVGGVCGMFFGFTLRGRKR